MKILEIQGQVEGGGSERHTFILSRALRELGHDVVLCVPEDAHEMIDEMVEDGFVVERFRLVPTWRRIADFAGALRIKRIIEEHQVDLVHTHLFNADAIGWMGARLTGRPVVTTIHGATLSAHIERTAMIRLFMRIMSQVFRRMDHRIAISPFLQRYVAYDVFLDPSTIEVIYNSSDVSVYDREFDREEIRASLGLPQDATVLLCLGVLNYQKRSGFFVDAAIQIASRRPGCHFVLAGHGYLRDELEARVMAAGHSDRIHFLGYRGDIPEILAATDMLVFPSQDEGFGRAMTEAMSSSIPVVAFDSGACPDVVEDGVTGFVVRDEDLDALIARSLELIDDPDLRERMGRAGLARARACFDVPTFARKNEAALERVLRDFGVRRGATS